MRAVLRTYMTCFLLILAALPLIFSVYIQISQSVIHHEMREELEKNNLVTIRVNKSALSWTEPGKEAIIHGNMFDVEKLTMNGGEIQLVGLFDKDEDVLITQLDNHEKTNPDTNGSELVLKWFSCFGWSQERELISFSAVQKLSNIPSLQKNNIEAPVLSCETPPPEELAFI